jgi:hypothetical protein
MMYSEVMLMEMLGMLRSIPSSFSLPINQSGLVRYHWLGWEEVLLQK